MFERLAEVPWGNLEASDGTAEWVPEALAELLDPDREVRAYALDRLAGGVFNEQVCSEATSHVVPSWSNWPHRPKLPTGRTS